MPKKTLKKIIVCLVFMAWLLPAQGTGKARAENFTVPAVSYPYTYVRVVNSNPVMTVVIISSAASPSPATVQANPCFNQTPGQINLNQPASCFSLVTKPRAVSNVSIKVEPLPFLSGQIVVSVPAAIIAGQELKVPGAPQAIPLLAVSFIALVVLFGDRGQTLLKKNKLLNSQKNTVFVALDGRFKILRC